MAQAHLVFGFCPSMLEKQDLCVHVCITVCVFLCVCMFGKSSWLDETCRWQESTSGLPRPCRQAQSWLTFEPLHIQRHCPDLIFFTFGQVWCAAPRILYRLHTCTHRAWTLCFWPAPVGTQYKIQEPITTTDPPGGGHNMALIFVIVIIWACVCYVKTELICFIWIKLKKKS